MVSQRGTHSLSVFSGSDFVILAGPDKGKAFSKVKVHLATCHLGFGGKQASKHLLVCSIMKSTRMLVPPGDLAVVLEGLKLLLLLLTLSSAKQVNDIHKLLVYPL